MEDWTWERTVWQNGRWVKKEFTMAELRAMNDEDLWDFLKEVYDEGYYDSAKN